MVQTDTTVGFTSSNDEKLSNIKQRPSNQKILKTLDSFVTLKEFARVPKKFRKIVRNSSKTTFIYPNLDSFRVVKSESIFFDFIKFVLKLAMPIIVGIAIAFIINVPMKQIERKIFNIDKRKHKKFIRLISLTLSIALIFGILGLILFLIIHHCTVVFSGLKTLASSSSAKTLLISKITTNLLLAFPMA